ncbi:hypothetical protein [Nocardia harenae]|uniref:hypothetical protein n=1 Tax=Nocardia harenae TaxID=358707 RepID=UPI000B2D4107|nr:hypothetical protein [Nocardia harenae]
MKADNYQHGFEDKALGIPPDYVFANYTGREVVAPLTVKVNVGKPNAGFLHTTSFSRAGPIPAKPFLEPERAGAAAALDRLGPFVVEPVNGAAHG